MQFTKYLDYLETLAKETGMRTLCEAVADAVSASDVGLEATLDDYMIKVGTEFRNMVISMGKDITEYAVNEAFKKNSDYVFKAFETTVSPKTVAAKLYGDAMTIPRNLPMWPRYTIREPQMTVRSRSASTRWLPKV